MGSLWHWLWLMPTCLGLRVPRAWIHIHTGLYRWQDDGAVECPARELKTALGYESHPWLYPVCMQAGRVNDRPYCCECTGPLVSTCNQGMLDPRGQAPRGMEGGGGGSVYFPKAQVLRANGICYNSLIRKQPLPGITPHLASPKPVPVPIWDLGPCRRCSEQLPASPFQASIGFNRNYQGGPKNVTTLSLPKGAQVAWRFTAPLEGGRHLCNRLFRCKP